jgi:tetrahydromethanopterin S-methyltransferase subunit G
MDDKVQVAILEERLEQFGSIVTRIDSAIEKLSEVNNNVSRMLAVHEERISRQEEVDTILFDKIDKLRDKVDSDHDGVNQRLSLLERKLWTGIGVLAGLVILTNPQALQTLKPLLSEADRVIVAPAVAIMNGSR